jgi:hypothetical protein
MKVQLVRTSHETHYVTTNTLGRQNNQVIVSRKKKNKIESGQGSHREARYPDELAD